MEKYTGEDMESFVAHSAQIDLAKIFCSVRLLGPPMSEKVVRLVAHLFSPAEAEVARHLPLYDQKPLKKIAKKAGRPPEEIRPLLEAMSERRVIVGGRRGYALIPLIPGMFEHMLMNGVDTEWHRSYARLMVDLLSTRYFRPYNKRPVPLVRNIPVEQTIDNQSRVLDADCMSEMIDRHTSYAVLNVCQCRQSHHFVGHECRRSSPEDGCLVFGVFAERAAKAGNGRAVGRSEMRDIVADRQEKQLVFLTGNVSPVSPNAVCTCCDCCCHFVDMINDQRGGMALAPPHFIARVDEGLCIQCGLCASACNVRAHTFEDKTHGYRVESCIGCGLCVEPCKPGAISMVENPGYKPPTRDFRRMALRSLPSTLLSAIQVKLSRFGDISTLRFF